MRCWLLLLLFILCSFTLAAETRGVEDVQVYSLPRWKEGKQYLVFISINEYRHWASLEYPVKDAEKIQAVMTKRFYVDDVFTLYNREATKEGILALFTDTLKNLLTEKDSLFLFYGGHGILSEGGFFLIPSDGAGESDTQHAPQSSWVSKEELLTLLNALPARHIGFITDACYAGYLVKKSRGALPAGLSKSAGKIYSKQSRLILTSGAGEAVFDKSEFAAALCSFLEAEEEPYVDMTDIYYHVKREMRETVPLLGPLEESLHQEGGSLLLFTKDIEPPPEDLPLRETLRFSGGTVTGLFFPAGLAEDIVSPLLLGGGLSLSLPPYLFSATLDYNFCRVNLAPGYYNDITSFTGGVQWDFLSSGRFHGEFSAGAGVLLINTPFGGTSPGFVLSGGIGLQYRMSSSLAITLQGGYKISPDSAVKGLFLGGGMVFYWGGKDAR